MWRQSQKLTHSGPRETESEGVFLCFKPRFPVSSRQEATRRSFRSRAKATGSRTSAALAFWRDPITTRRQRQRKLPKVNRQKKKRFKRHTFRARKVWRLNLFFFCRFTFGSLRWRCRRVVMGSRQNASAALVLEPVAFARDLNDRRVASWREETGNRGLKQRKTPSLSVSRGPLWVNFWL